MSAWRVYLTRCADGSLYCGSTTDLRRREAEHQGGRGSRYVRAKGRAWLVWASAEIATRSEAQRLEARVKRMRKAAKERLVAGESRSSAASR